jgi:hypothetical protein
MLEVVHHRLRNRLLKNGYAAMDMSLLQRITSVWYVGKKSDQPRHQIYRHYHRRLMSAYASMAIHSTQMTRYVCAVGQNLNPSFSHLLHRRSRKEKPFMIFSAQGNWHRTLCAGCCKS